MSNTMRTSQRYGLATLFLLLQLSGCQKLFGQSLTPHPIDLADGNNSAQYAFLSPLLEGAEVISLAESIHMTHEFPLVRIGMVRWINENLGFSMLAIEGSPEDLWVSQDAFLRDPSNLAQSTSGLFGVWNTTEMQQLFAYEASTWQTSHPLYITSYDIQPGAGRASHGVRVFQLLAQGLTRYAPPPPGFDAAIWFGSLSPLTDSCSQFRPKDETKVTQAIGLLQEWIDRAGPSVEKTYPHVSHAASLRLIPENLRGSLTLCKEFASGIGSGAGLYKSTRDRIAARFVIRLKETAPQQKIILWAHVSHLFYDSAGESTSVGEILHASLGTGLYTIGTFAGGGSAIMLFSDWHDIAGYGRIWGVSGSLKRTLEDGCPEICFFDLRKIPSNSALSKPQHVWFEANPFHLIAMSKDFDGIVWVRHVHPPLMPLRSLLAYSTPRYWWLLSAGLLFSISLAVVILLLGRTILRRGH
jgi:erythromycin esterase-like protein